MTDTKKPTYPLSFQLKDGMGTVTIHDHASLANIHDIESLPNAEITLRHKSDFSILKLYLLVNTTGEMGFDTHAVLAFRNSVQEQLLEHLAANGLDGYTSASHNRGFGEGGPTNTLTYAPTYRQIGMSSQGSGTSQVFNINGSLSNGIGLQGSTPQTSERNHWAESPGTFDIEVYDRTYNCRLSFWIRGVGFDRLDHVLFGKWLEREIGESLGTRVTVRNIKGVALKEVPAQSHQFM